MTTEELKQTITLLQKELAKREELAVVSVPKWEPQGGYWFVGYAGQINYGDSDIDSRLFGVEFTDEAKANKACNNFQRYHRLYKLAEELNEGWEPDWNDEVQHKWYVLFDYTTEEFSKITQIYFKDKQTALKAIEIIKDGGLD